MRKFLNSILIFISIPGIPLILILIGLLFYLDNTPDKFDVFYRRFTSPKQSSLIIGSSRAAQGIQPSIINDNFKSHFTNTIYNYSFTIKTSPFGKAYYNSIKRKLKESGLKDGLFIIAVDPWSLSNITEMGDNKILREDAECVSKMILVNTKPNIEYFIRYFDMNWFKSETGCILHDDGWLEINADMNLTHVKKNISNKINEYSKYHFIKSENRIFYLIKTIDYLKNYGKVYLVRIPTSIEMAQLEFQRWPNFDKDIYSISKNQSIKYFSFKSEIGKYRTIDGNHLYKADAKKFSKNLSDSIQLNSSK